MIADILEHELKSISSSPSCRHRTHFPTAQYILFTMLHTSQKNPSDTFMDVVIPKSEIYDSPPSYSVNADEGLLEV